MSFAKTYSEAKATHRPLSRKTPMRRTGIKSQPVSLSEGEKVSQKGRGLKRGGRLRPLGKKGKAWAKTRDGLKLEYAAVGITTCELRYEGCADDDYLGFAHAAKRRKLSREDLGHVILACNFCHDLLEVMPPEKMKQIVDETIQRREVKP